MGIAAAAAALLLACGLPAGREYERARAAFLAGEWPRARELAGEAGGRWKSGSNWNWRFRLLEARTLLYQGDDSGGKRLLGVAAPPGELLAEWHFLNAVLARNEGDLERALGLLDQAERKGPGSELASEVLSARANIRIRQGRIPEAESILRGQLAEGALRGDAHQQASALVNLGFLSVENGRFDRAAGLMRRAAEHCLRSGNRLLHSAAMNNLAVSLHNLGEHEQAKETVRQLMKEQEAAGAERMLMNSLGTYGSILLDGGDSREAAESLKKAITAAGRAGDSRLERAAASMLVSAYMASGKVEEAEQWTRAAVNGGQAAVGRDLYNRAAIEAARGRTEAAVRLFRRLAGDGDVDPRLQWEAWSELARIHGKRQERVLADRCFESALEVIEKTRADLAHAEFQLSFLARLIRFYQEYVEELLGRPDRQKPFEVEEASRARLMRTRMRMEASGRSPVRLDRLPALARSLDAALLSYWISPRGSHVWAVTSEGTRLVRLAVEVDGLVKLVESQRSQIEGLREAAGGPARELYRQLLEPVAETIRRHSRVIIVPDGPLHGLNFETLVSGGEAPRYFLEDATVMVASSLGVLAQPEEEGTGEADGVLAIGDPVTVDPDFPRLDHAAGELAALEKAFGAGRVVVRKEAAAAPEALLESSPERFRYIHFAAHAKANRDAPLESAVILSGPAERYKLYARDVMDLQLRAELVTVSACRSAGARVYSGEGLIGFAWAFLRAGARNVIAGLWDVNDRSTRLLMDRLYQGLASGAPPAEALRAAKLAMIERGGNYRKPWYWGPFQLYTRAPGERSRKI